MQTHATALESVPVAFGPSHVLVPPSDSAVTLTTAVCHYGFEASHRAHVDDEPAVVSHPMGFETPRL